MGHHLVPSPTRWARTATADRRPARSGLNSGSPIAEANISVPRPPPPPAAPPPRRVGAHIPDMRAAPPRPPTPNHMLGAARAWRAKSRARVAGDTRVVTTLTKRKKWSRAARARYWQEALDLPISRPLLPGRPRSRPTPRNAPRGPSGKTSLLKSRRPRRRTPTRPSLGGKKQDGRYSARAR